jgi:hypothetical protein
MTGAQLQKLLDRAKISQIKGAALLDINERTMRRYVADDRKIPVKIELAARYLWDHELVKPL